MESTAHAPPVRTRRPRDGWIVALSLAALVGAIVAFVKLEPRKSTAGESVVRRAVAGHSAPLHLAAVQAAAPEKAERPSDAAADGEETDEQAWKQIAATVGTAGTLKDGVYTVALPRTDLTVTLHGNDVPAGAGLESRFHFYRCACGRMNVVGQFVVADYEANGVLDALRRPSGDAEVEIASVGPLLLYEKPRMTEVRFQGEAGKAGDLARTIKTALDRTGRARTGEQPLEFQ